MAAGAELLLLQIAVVYVAAKVASYGATWVRVPPLVGEILVGVIVINSAAADWLQLGEGTDLLEALAELGVIFLVFTVGLEVDVRRLLAVGGTAASSAVLGVIVPFTAGALLFIAWGFNTAESLFVGVAMVATSVGITARVLGEMNALQTTAAQIILGAAVMDDVLGLLLLTFVSSAVATGVISPLEIGIIAGTAIVFLLIAGALGRGVVTLAFLRPKKRQADHWAGGLHGSDLPFIVAIGLCLTLSAAASQFRLAPIVGAFLAGLAFDATAVEGELIRRMETLTAFLTPFFFVFIGLAVDVRALSDAWLLALVVTAVAFMTKVVGCGLGALRAGRSTALAVGVGMAPRGEVGIIVALLGLNLGIVEESVYGVVVAMSVLTTVIAPPLLSWALRRIPASERGDAPTDPPGA